MTNDRIKKINVYMDGKYANHIVRFISDYKGRNVNWNALFDYIAEIIKKNDFDPNASIKICNKYCITTSDKEERFSNFTQELSKAGVKKVIVDNGIPVSLALHVLEDIHSPNTVDSMAFDYAVIIAGDSELAPLFDYLQSKKIKTILVHYEFRTPFREEKTSTLLIDKSDCQISMVDILNDDSNPQAKEMFPKNEDVRRIREPSFSEILETISGLQKDENGYVLANEVGKVLRQKGFSFKTKLKDLFKLYPTALETNDKPAFRVRVTGRNAACHTINDLEHRECGIIKFVTPDGWGIISGNHGDYHFIIESGSDRTSFATGARVEYTITKECNPSASSSKERNGKAANIKLV